MLLGCFAARKGFAHASKKQDDYTKLRLVALDIIFQLTDRELMR